MHKKCLVVIMILVFAFIACTACSNADTSSASETASDAAETESSSETDSSKTEAEDNLPAASTASDAASADYTPTAYAEIVITGYDPILVGLDANAAPKTVANFIDLAESGFYDGLTFHRIMDGFMMQGGDPAGNGTGGAETNVEGEFDANGVANPLSHTRGAISMARSQDYDSASSQFFIVQSDSTFLDGEYAAFGYVEDGMDVVDAICAAAQPLDNNGTIAADAQPVIESITIREA